MGRIVDVLDDGVTPRFVLGRAQEGVIWRFRHDLSTDLVQDVSRLAGREKGIPIDPESAPPPERWVMIERRFSVEDGRKDPIRIGNGVLHERVSREGQVLGEIWTVS